MSKKGLTEDYLTSVLHKQLLKDKTTWRYLNRHSISTEELARANKLLEGNLAGALKASFENAGKSLGKNPDTII